LIQIFLIQIKEKRRAARQPLVCNGSPSTLRRSITTLSLPFWTKTVRMRWHLPAAACGADGSMRTRASRSRCALRTGANGGRVPKADAKESEPQPCPYRCISTSVCLPVTGSLMCLILKIARKHRVGLCFLVSSQQWTVSASGWTSNRKSVRSNSVRNCHTCFGFLARSRRRRRAERPGAPGLRARRTHVHALSRGRQSRSEPARGRARVPRPQPSRRPRWFCVSVARRTDQRPSRHADLSFYPRGCPCPDRVSAVHPDAIVDAAV